MDTLIEKELLSKQAAEMLVDKIDMMKKSVLARAFSGKLGTNNDPNDESVDGLLKKILSDKVNEKRNKSKPKNARIVIPDEIDNLLQTDLERKIIKLFYKIFTDADPGVTDNKAEAALIFSIHDLLCCEGHDSRCGREFDGIAQRVEQHLLELCIITDVGFFQIPDYGSLIFKPFFKTVTLKEFVE